MSSRVWFREAITPPMTMKKSAVPACSGIRRDTAQMASRWLYSPGRYSSGCTLTASALPREGAICRWWCLCTWRYTLRWCSPRWKRQYVRSYATKSAASAPAVDASVASAWLRRMCGLDHRNRSAWKVNTGVVSRLKAMKARSVGLKASRCLPRTGIAAAALRPCRASTAAPMWGTRKHSSSIAAITSTAKPAYAHQGASIDSSLSAAKAAPPRAWRTVALSNSAILPNATGELVQEGGIRYGLLQQSWDPPHRMRSVRC
mmetsp:Transcript_31313/g.79120  ORF Transcript_31313/g.79120 Transcript_31313/m.79120 type:complete len:260 (+) Transcript_31313:180-959(+)